MRKPIIEVNNLGKVYNINHEKGAAPGTMTLRDNLNQLIRKPIELVTGHRLQKEKFWAIKDVNVNIEPGDVIGLIGKNGSGKSTLLKMLSRIVEPTEGEIIMRGKSASLLEVGTGFHPELTGRENIYFNGAILGMSQKEIRSKFDQIVAFSGVEKFLDTPVKFYSSGMYVRLAFAVAAHLEPDILIVDEVLAVGDAEFQKKSLGKMKDVTADKNRTVIFVSHSMDAIMSICNKCIWLSEGQIKAFGDTAEVVQKYRSGSEVENAPDLKTTKNRTGSGEAKFDKIEIGNKIASKQELDIDLSVHSDDLQAYENVKMAVDIIDDTGNHVASMSNVLLDKKLAVTKGSNQYSFSIKNICLVPGKYFVNLLLVKDTQGAEILDLVQGAATVHVPPYDFYNVGQPPSPGATAKFIYMDFIINT